MTALRRLATVVRSLHAASADTPTGERHGSPPPTHEEASLAPTWLAIAVAAGLLFWVFRQPVIGDERLQYTPSFRVSARAWPTLNTTDVSYGISATYLWVVGGLTRVIEEPILVGRLLSWASHAALLACCFARGRLTNGLMLLILLHPVTLLYAARAHPFIPGLALLYAATTLMARHRLWSFALTALATNVQAFLLPCTLLLPVSGWVKNGGGAPTPWIVRCVFFGAAGLVGVVANWVLYGGQYPEGFVDSSTYLTFNTGSPSLGYIVLIPAFVGFWGWVGGRGFGERPSRRALIAAAIGAAAVAVPLLTYGCAPALGPVASLMKKVHMEMLYGLLVGVAWAGWLWLPRDRSLLLPIVGTAAAGAAITGLPWFYERYAWFAANTIMLMLGRTYPTKACDGARVKFWLVAVALIAYGVVQFHDMVVTNRIDPLWLWNRSTP
jgi:hypothetical protein